MRAWRIEEVGNTHTLLLDRPVSTLYHPAHAKYITGGIALGLLIFKRQFYVITGETMKISLVVIVLSISLQIIAAWMAIRLIAIHKKHTAGVLLLLMIIMQILRRIISLYRAISNGYIKADIYAEIAALIVSIILVFGIIYIIKLIKELSEAINRIKILKGLLPICASCKKIRDDKGSWVYMEKYIMQHSEAKFSHGVCDECAKKLYPSYFNGDK